MNILIVLRNIYKNKDLFDNEEYLSKSDHNIITEALKIKDKYDVKIKTVLLGEDVIENDKTLKESLAMGVDKSYLINSKDLDLTDQKQSALVLKKFIEKYEKDLDLILFGRLAYTGDSVHIATLLAEILDIKRVMYSKEFHFKDEKIEIIKKIDNNTDYKYKLDKPLVIQSIRDKDLVRYPTIEDIINAYSKKEIEKIDIDDLISKIDENDLVLYRNIALEEDLNKDLVDLTDKSDLDSAKNLVEVLRKLSN